MNKKFQILALCILMSSVFSPAEAKQISSPDSCAAAFSEEAKDISGYYISTYTEFIQGEKYESHEVLILKPDRTGFLVCQDSVPITWDMQKIVFDKNYGGNILNYVLDGKNIILDYDGRKINLSRCSCTHPVIKEVLKYIEPEK